MPRKVAQDLTGAKSSRRSVRPPCLARLLHSQATVSWRAGEADESDSHLCYPASPDAVLGDKAPSLVTAVASGVRGPIRAPAGSGGQSSVGREGSRMYVDERVRAWLSKSVVAVRVLTALERNGEVVSRSHQQGQPR
jgi:hypothetical protein